ncbi:MAG: biotin--[acetyl-CoA-carboxylase] ligase [Moraxella sp.]|nr:biotin--[acetyl-CoA-carboxylase] ligase [Moraxella sp.]
MSHFLSTVTHRHFERIGSTNTELIHAIAGGTLDHSTHHLYTADHQTAGRGQHGRTWVSGADNVFLSLYVPLGKKAYQLHTLSGLLSLAVGLSLLDLPIIKTLNTARKKSALPPIGVKWANDIGYDAADGFKKLAGILIEPAFKKYDEKNTLAGVVIGVGLNVNHSPEIKDGLYQATCLKALIPNNDLSDFARPKMTAENETAFYHSINSSQTDASTLSAHALYTPMTNALLTAVMQCNSLFNPTALTDFITAFNHAHLLHNKQVQIFIQNNTTDIHTEGVCIGIGKTGELLLDNDGHTTPVFAGMAKRPNYPQSHDLTCSPFKENS